MSLIQLTLIEKEINFLNACDFDTSDGYCSSDVSYFKKINPELYKQYVTHW